MTPGKPTLPGSSSAGARLRTKQGAVLYAIETPNGYVLTSLDPRVKDQVERGEAFMDRYRDVFAALAK